MKMVYDVYGDKHLLRLDPVKQYFYHITDKMWPKTITLEPLGDGPGRDDEELRIPRICVCPSVALCVSAVSISCMTSIYKTKTKVKAYFPKKIVDSKITEEHWLIDDTIFIKVGELNKKITKQIQECYTDFSFGGTPVERVRQKIFKQNVIEILRKCNLEYP